MIKFSMACEVGHEFEGWFSGNDEFDSQSERGFVTCPQCGIANVSKALMTPGIPAKGRDDRVVMAAVSDRQQKIVKKMRELRDLVTANAENAGPKFAEEARKIHYGETEARGIYGNTSPEEASKLVAEGIQVIPLPVLPEDKN